MITFQYRVTVTCDTCGKRMRRRSDGNPPAQTVPRDWVQAAPPGETQQREFCTAACLEGYASPFRPWTDDDDDADAADDFVDAI